jgi:cytochrome c-type biogenesis protein CcmH
MIRNVRLIVAGAALVAGSAGVAIAQAGGAPPGPPSASSQAQTSSQRTVADSILEARTSALSSHLRCVVCQGLSIEDSPSELARQMRDIVKDQLRSGKSEEDVRAYFISKYGEWILLEPKASGFNLLVYLLPALALLAGVGLIVRSVRRWTAPATDTPLTVAPRSAPSADPE